MKLTNETITLFIPYCDAEGETSWKRFVITGVSWYQTNKAEITVNGLKSADVVNVRIPESSFPSEYVSYIFFDPEEDSFALHEGMPVCLGEVQAPSGALLSGLIEAYGRERVKTLLSFTENLRGREPHIRLVLT